MRLLEDVQHRIACIRRAPDSPIDGYHEVRGLRIQLEVVEAEMDRLEPLVKEMGRKRPEDPLHLDQGIKETLEEYAALERVLSEGQELLEELRIRASLKEGR